MTRLLIGLGAALIAWGGFVLVTGDFVATVDIAAGLVASGCGVIALASVGRSLERIAGLLAERNEQRALQAQGRPAADRPRAPAQPPQPELPPAPERRNTAEPERRPQIPPVPENRLPDPEPERRREAPVVAGPQVIREGVIEGQRFRFYDDGSIEAEGPRGVRRYRSIDEAREQIMRDRAEQAARIPKPAPPEPPPEARPPPQEAPRPPRMPPEASEAPAQRPSEKTEQDLTWDAYLSGGRKNESDPAPIEDDQWSEPFRMLLRGDAPPPPAPDQKPLKR